MKQIKDIHFWRDKYGKELLVDIVRIEELDDFIVDDTPHRLTFYDITFVTGGSGTISLDFQECPVAPNNVLFTCPGQIRQWHVPSGVSGVALFFAAGFIESFFNDALFLHKLLFFHSARTPLHLVVSRDLFCALTGSLVDAEAEMVSLRRDSEHMLRAILYQLLIRLNRLYSVAYGTAADTETHMPVHRFRRLIERRFRESHRVQDYAQLLGITPDYLNDLCKRYAGATAGTMIRDRLLIESKRLLRYSGLTVSEVGYYLGFPDPSYFARFFKRYVGASPTSYRDAMSE